MLEGGDILLGTVSSPKWGSDYNRGRSQLTRRPQMCRKEKTGLQWRPKGLPVMDVSPEPAYVMLREGWDCGFPGEVSTLILPLGQCLNSLIQDCQTDTHIHHVSAIRLEEIEIAQKARLILWCRNIGWEFSGVSEWVAAYQLTTVLRAEGWTEVTFPLYVLQMCWAQGCPLYTCRLSSFFIEEWKIKVRFFFNSESTVEGLAQGM